MILLNKAQRDHLLSVSDGLDIITRYVQYHRFLENASRLTYIQDHLVPSFELYWKWLDDYPGWTYGLVNENHLAWKPEYDNLENIPMNKYYLLPVTQWNK